jgi:diguanylate cyclase (GGDEF)-like protein
MTQAKTTTTTRAEAGLWSRFSIVVLGPHQFRRVWFLTIGLVLAGLMIFFATAHPVPQAEVSVPWWGFALLVALIEFPLIHLYVKSEAHSFTLGELALCLGLFLVTPPQFVIGATLGAILAKLRLPPVKLAFNGALWFLQANVAVGIFGWLGNPGAPFGGRSVAAAFLAMFVVGALGVFAVSAAISIVEGRLSPAKLGMAGSIALAVNVANTGLGMIAGYLIANEPQLVIALVGPVAVLFLAYRAFVQEHQQHQRLQVIYTATRSILEAPELGAATASVLAQAREVFRADVAQMVLYPDRPGDPIIVRTDGPGDQLPAVRAVADLDGTVFQTVALTRRAELIGPEGVTSRGGLVGLDDAGLHGVIVAPLEGERRIVGAIAVANRLGEAASFDASDLTLLDTLAGHAGVAIGNGRLERALEELTALQAELSMRATHDSLTGLANRAHFESCVQSALARGDGDVAVLYVDLDDFKMVNDTFGHAIGDLTLKQLATRLRGCLRGDDLAGRLGGDEFAVLVHNVVDVDQLSRLADRIKLALEVLITWPGGELHPGVSLGVAMATPGMDAEELLAQGDTAMYQAKRAGKGRAAVYDGAMRDADQTRADLVRDLSNAPGRGELVLFYQPIVSLPERKIVAVEALVRWERPGVGRLSPAEFMPIAEEAGLASLIGEWVVREACGQVVRWGIGGVGAGELGVHINISPAHLAASEFQTRVLEAVHASGLAAERLTLEITEQVLVSDDPVLLERLTELRERGVRVAVDDFGTGVSSLAKLGSYPVDALKIPGSFVTRDASEQRPALADALVTIGRTLGIPTIAETIETEYQVERLELLGCERVQGHVIAAAMPAEEFGLWLLGDGASAPNTCRRS